MERSASRAMPRSSECIVTPVRLGSMTGPTRFIAWSWPAASYDATGTEQAGTSMTEHRPEAGAPGHTRISPRRWAELVLALAAAAAGVVGLWATLYAPIICSQ